MLQSSVTWRPVISKEVAQGSDAAASPGGRLDVDGYI